MFARRPASDLRYNNPVMSAIKYPLGSVDRWRSVRATHAILMLVALVLASLPAFPAQLGDATEVASVTRFTIRSGILSEDRIVFVYVPDTYDQEASQPKKYPVLYLLDGRAYFEATIGVAHHLGSWNAAVPGITAFRTALDGSKTSVQWSYHYFDDESHLSVPLQAIYRGLLFVYQGYDPPARDAAGQIEEHSK